MASAAAAAASTVTLGFNLVYCAFVLRCLVKVSLLTHFVIVCIFFTRTFSQLQVVDVFWKEDSTCGDVFLPAVSP